MKNNLLIFIILIGFFGILSCEKDETRAILSTSPAAPSITKADNVVLKRADATKLIEIIASKADFGFEASVKYTLEADVVGNQFKSPIVLGVANEPTFSVSVFDLNNALIKTLPTDKLAKMELRVKALVVSSSASTKPIETVSATKAIDITTYGPPTLALTSDPNLQGIVSPTDDGKYSGWFYTDGTAFTLTNRDNAKVYGGAGGVLAQNGAAFQLEAGGYDMKVDVNALTYTAEDVTIGIIGDAVGGWDNDTKMTYNFADKTWNIRKAVTAGGIKF